LEQALIMRYRLPLRLHGLKIAVAQRLRLGLGALLITDRFVVVGVCVRAHGRARDLLTEIIAEGVERDNLPDNVYLSVCRDTSPLSSPAQMPTVRARK